jgi:hypothetical protein
VIRSWAFAAIAVLVVAIPIAGCGGGSDTASAPSDALSPKTQQSQRQGGRAEESGGGEKSIEEFGEEAAGPERAAIEGAFTGYLDALAEEDPRTACSYLAARVRQSLERLVVERLKGKGCAAILPELLSGSAAVIAREQAQGEIAKVRVEGDRGFVVFHAPGAKLYQMTMVREGGEWKVANLGSSVLVPEL